jgi:hypothetical protein
MRLRLSFVLFLALTLAQGLQAQSVHWDPPGGMLAVGQARSLALVFEDCAPKGQPTPPKVAGLNLQFYGQSSNTSIVNFSMSQSTTLTYAAMLSKNERVEIPSFEVETDKGRLRVPAARFDPTGATVGNSGTPLESATTAKLTATPNSVYAGEVFDLVTTAEAARSYVPQFQRTFEWNAEPLFAEGWSNPEQVDFNSGGEPHIGISFRARAIARSPGSLKLNPATHVVNLSVGVSGFGFFQQRQYDQFSVATNAPVVEVKPLPSQPAGFNGAVGQFKLSSKVVPANAAIGEPITWTLELTGTGNWPDIPGLPSRDVSRDFNVVQPQAKRTPAEGKIFDATLAEDVVLVPTKAGDYTLGPINFVYFDPKAGTYKTVSTPRHKVTVNPPATPAFTFTPPPTGSTENATSKTETPPNPLSKTPPPVALLPSGIPRDPLPGAEIISVPWDTTRLFLTALTPFGGALLLWIGLAMRRAQQTDPALPRRRARERLAATLAKLRSAKPTEQAPLLLAWQKDAAILWEIPHAAPAPLAFNEVAWAQLWKEADRALYGTETALPADWLARAEAALKSKRVPGFQPARLFLPRNLVPFLFGGMLIALLSPAESRAQDAASSYRSGNFSEAETTWRAALAKTPTDAVARHNLSLALAQQDRWNEAAAHSAIAFVQSPTNPAVHWQFRLAADKAGTIPAPLAVFLQPGFTGELAARASPTRWQQIVVAAAVGAALAIAAMLFNAYRGRSRAVFRSALAAFVIFSAVAIVAVFGVAAYGVAADNRAVITWRPSTLRSIPTEADTTQKTTPLSAGTLAIVDKVFPLGWVRLSFENGQTGWVRNEEVIALWK